VRAESLDSEIQLRASGGFRLVVRSSSRYPCSQGSQSGFTLVEVLVAALVFAAGALGVLAALDTATRNSYRAEQSQVAINVAQRELEKLRQVPYADLALTSAPVTSSVDPTLRTRLTSNTFALAPTGGATSPLVVRGVGGQATGVVDPGPTPFQLGDVSGKIYRYVVWQDEPGCGANCPGTQDYKRVSIIVKLDTVASSSSRPYQEVQSDFADPDSVITEGGTGGGSGGLVTAQQVFLSDAPCSTASTEPARVEPSADHPTHDTLSTCASASGKPDALLFDQPTDPAPGDPSLPGTFDYSDEIEPGGTSSQIDRGLQMLRQDTNGCNPSPTGTDAKKKIHRWVTRPMPIEFDTTGSATLELYTRTIDNVNIPGGLCFYLFRRLSGASADTRTPIPLTAISAVTPDPFGYGCSVVGSPAVGKCQTSIWPRSGTWNRVRFSLGFSPSTTIPAGERLELGLSVERAATPQDALEFMYDHPDYPARLEVKTTTPITD
jgi:prepilin-type N-terminal cleavage/methylation domain-containing protein